MGGRERDPFNASNPGETFDPQIDNDKRITRGMTSLALENRYAKTSGTLSFFYNWGKTLDQRRVPSRRAAVGLSLRRATTCWVCRGNQSVRLFEGKSPDGRVRTISVSAAKAWNLPVGGGGREMQADKIQHETAGYVDFRQSLTRWLTFDAGLRLDHPFARRHGSGCRKPDCRSSCRVARCSSFRQPKDFVIPPSASCICFLRPIPT